MSWKTIIGICSRCKKEDKLFPAFGKWICLDCKSNRPKKFSGNAGMFSSDQIPITMGNNLYLERVQKSNGYFGRLFFEHYPNSKGIPGRSFCYIIHNLGKAIGIIGFNSPPRGYRKFREFFGVEDDNLYMSNNVFRIIDTEKNLGTKILKLARQTVFLDHIQKWGFPLIGLVTFVELPRTGAIYKADNWIYLGLTKGIRMKRDKDTWNKIYEEGIQKHIFGYKYK